MHVTYHVPEAECRALTTRPSYCGRSWDEQLASAAKTAAAWGVAYISVTRSIPDRRAGGRILVTRTRETWMDPTALLAKVED